MRLIDDVHLQYPFYGSRWLRDWLGDRGQRVSRKRIQRLMRLMGLTTLYPRPRTSRPDPGHKVYPYLLRNLTVERPNQVWAADICHIPRWPRDSSTWSPSWTGTAARRLLGGCPIAWKATAVSRRLRRHCNASGARSFSTQIRVPSSPARRLPRCSRPMRLPSAWTVRALGQ